MEPRDRLPRGITHQAQTAEAQEFSKVHLHFNCSFQRCQEQKHDLLFLYLIQVSACTAGVWIGCSAMWLLQNNITLRGLQRWWKEMGARDTSFKDKKKWTKLFLFSKRTPKYATVVAHGLFSDSLKPRRFVPAYGIFNIFNPFWLLGLLAICYDKPME